MPELFTGVRVGIGIGWTTLIAAEMIAASSGLGWMVINASSYLRTDVVMLGILLLGTIGYLLDLVIVTTQRRRFTGWAKANVQAAAPVDYAMNVTPPAAQATVELRNVGKTFIDRKRGRETVALADVSMTIGKSEFACILGPSGCGKSTILNLVAGFEQPNSGAVLIDGRPIAAPDRSRGMVFQQPLLFPWLNVIDNITFGPRMAGAPAGSIRRSRPRAMCS